MTPRQSATRATLTLLVPCVALLAANISIYYPFISDDALISLRYAGRLLAGEGLTWTAGHPVEGYSNLLWVLMVAGVGMVGVDLIFAARLLGVLGVITSLWFLLAVGVRPGRLSSDWFPTGVGLLFVALSPPMAVWAIGGLEQPLVGALLAASVPLMYGTLDTQTSQPTPHRHLFGLSAVLGLLAITRPDGPLFAAAAAGTFLLCGPGRRTTRWRGALRILSLPVLCYAGQALFRYIYYGELVPNTALVKLTPSAVRRSDGLEYVWAGLQALSPLSFLAIVAMFGLLSVPGRRGRAVYLLTLSSLWSAYLVVIGGDIFPAFRHFVPLIVVFGFALIEGIQALWPLLSGRRLLTTAVVVVTLAQFAVFVPRQHNHKQSQRAVTERWEWQCKDLGVVLKTAFSPQQPLLAVTAAGCLPYWSELPALDMLGLNDYYLPRHPPPDFGTGFLGHELGNGAYVLGRAPDLIVFSVGSEPSFRSGIELAGMPEFHDRYVPMTVRVEGMETAPLVFVDRYSQKIGIRLSAFGISVPGFLFRSPQTVANLNGVGTLVASLRKDEPALVSFAAGPADWEIQVVSPQADLVAAHLEHTAGRLTITLSTTNPTPVEIEAVLLKPPQRLGGGR